MYTCVVFITQVALTGTQIYWTVEVAAAFARLEEGYENALRDYYRKQVLKYFVLMYGQVGVCNSWYTVTILVS